MDMWYCTIYCIIKSYDYYNFLKTVLLLSCQCHILPWNDTKRTTVAFLSQFLIVAANQSVCWPMLLIIIQGNNFICTCQPKIFHVKHLCLHGFPKFAWIICNPKRSCGRLGSSSFKDETWVHTATWLINRYFGNKGHQCCKKIHFFFSFIGRKFIFNLILTKRECWKKDSYKPEMLEE